MIEQPDQKSSNWNYSLIVLPVIAMASLVIAYKSYNLKKSKPEPVMVEPKVERVTQVSNLENL